MTMKINRPSLRCLVMFITAVCLLFLLKLKWPKNKSVYDLASSLHRPLVFVPANSPYIYFRGLRIHLIVNREYEFRDTPRLF